MRCECPVIFEVKLVSYAINPARLVTAPLGRPSHNRPVCYQAIPFFSLLLGNPPDVDGKYRVRSHTHRYNSFRNAVEWRRCG